MPGGGARPLRELGAGAANRTVGARLHVQEPAPAVAAKPHGRSRESLLAGLEQLAGCDTRFLGPTPVHVPAAAACHLRLTSGQGCQSPAGDSSEHGVPVRIALDRSPLLVGRNGRGGADILLVDPQEPKLISLQHAVFRFVQAATSSPPGRAGGWEVTRTHTHTRTHSWT
jgi:hypothetical protein